MSSDNVGLVSKLNVESPPTVVHRGRITSSDVPVYKTSTTKRDAKSSVGAVITGLRIKITIPKASHFVPPSQNLIILCLLSYMEATGLYLFASLE
ncbi:hypothetical protein AHF37_01215 [Paragonimus kellicotti]|nr:hypothetical protein AHF37_01215 [Paragonimus kellicotti]